MPGLKKDLRERKKEQLKSLLFWIVAWNVAMFFLNFIRRFGDLGRVLESGAPDAFDLDNIIRFLIPLASLAGALYHYSELLFSGERMRKMSYGKVIIIRSTYHLLTFIFLWSIAFFLIPSSKNFLQIVMLRGEHHIVLQELFVNSIYFFVISIIFNLYAHINKILGKNVLKNILFGKYHTPTEEERIFMFLDLKSSTTIAEKLGHRRYSAFINDCFYDLSDVVQNHSGEILQYVGDEAVISWPVNRGVLNNRCVQLFLSYNDLLEGRRQYYLDKYGVAPIFKAGVGSGVVTVAEVGEIKKEIAYHGDVLNTTARIQELCNKYNTRILISESLYRLLPMSNSGKFEEIGCLPLRGKDQLVKVYSLKNMDIIPKALSHEKSA